MILFQKQMSYIKDILISSISCPEFWDCKIICSDGNIKTNKLFLWAFGNRDLFPNGLYSDIPGLNEELLVIIMKDFKVTEVRKACQTTLPLSVVKCDNSNSKSVEMNQSAEDLHNLPSLELNSKDLRIKGPSPSKDRLQSSGKEQHFCDRCGKFYKTSKLFSVHLYQQHPKTPSDKFACSKCSRKFHHKFQLTKHDKIVHSDLLIPCPECSHVYKSKKALNHHRKSVHEK